MLSSLLSEHVRRLNILERLVEGRTDFPLYQPGTLNGGDLLSGFTYSGKILALRLESRRSLRLDFWLQNFIGERWFIARNVDVRGGDDLLEGQIQGGLRLGGDITLGCSLSQGQRLASNDEVNIWGFVEERGAPRPRVSLGGPSAARWGEISGNLAEQDDLVNILDEKVATLELTEALLGVDAQAEQLEALIAANTAAIAANTAAHQNLIDAAIAQASLGLDQKAEQLEALIEANAAAIATNAAAHQTLIDTVIPQINLELQDLRAQIEGAPESAPLVPIMTGESAPAPFIARSSHPDRLLSPPWLAFDGNPGSTWLSFFQVGGGPVRLEVFVGPGKTITSFSLTSGLSEPNNREPRLFSLQSSENGVDWTTVESFDETADNWHLETKTYDGFNLSSPWVGLLVSADYGAGALELSTIQFFGFVE